MNFLLAAMPLSFAMAFFLGCLPPLSVALALPGRHDLDGTPPPLGHPKQVRPAPLEQAPEPDKAGEAENKNPNVKVRLGASVEELVKKYGKPALISNYLSDVQLYVWKGEWPEGRIIFVDRLSKKLIYIYPTDIDSVMVNGKKITVTFKGESRSFESRSKTPVFRLKMVNVSALPDKVVLEPRLFLDEDRFLTK